jgi:hypothetical protein
MAAEHQGTRRKRKAGGLNFSFINLLDNISTCELNLIIGVELKFHKLLSKRKGNMASSAGEEKRKGVCGGGR